MSKQTSLLRQRLRASCEELSQQITMFVQEHGPLIRGSLGTRARICGNPGCKCARGELHQSKYISASDGGRTRQIHITAGDEVRVAEGVKRYRRFREARSRLAKYLAELAARQLALVDELGNSLLEPYPPNNPLPPPKRRGRPAKAPKR